MTIDAPLGQKGSRAMVTFFAATPLTGPKIQAQLESLYGNEVPREWISVTAGDFKAAIQRLKFGDNPLDGSD